MLEKIESLKSAVEALNASTKEEVEALRIKYLSKKGEISALFNDFRNVPNEQKKEIGQKLNQLKVLATDKINALRENVETSDDADAAIDLTLLFRRSAHAILSRLSAMRLYLSSRVLDSRLPTVRKWRTTGTCSRL